MAKIPRTLGGYRLQREIGHGGMGSVCLATDDAGNEVVIKILYPQFSKDENFVKRFEREAHLAQKITHPAVAKTITLGNHDDVFFIVMEYIDGETLTDYLRAKGIAVSDGVASKEEDTIAAVRIGLPLNEALRIIKETASVLEAGHKVGLVHRDIKPDNLMLEAKDSRVRLLDFGLAKDLGEDSLGLSMTGTAMGTPGYMSPEQWESSKTVDIRTDLYALGIIAYQLIAGSPPFKANTSIEFMHQHREVLPKSITTINKEIPIGVSQLVDKLLAKDPADRHQTPTELLADIERVASGRGPLKIYKPRRPKIKIPWLTITISAMILSGVIASGYEYIYMPLKISQQNQRQRSEAKIEFQRAAGRQASIEGRFREAAVCFEQAAFFSGLSVDQEQSQKYRKLVEEFDSLLDLAETAHAKGHIDLATKRFETAEKLWPGHGAAMRLRDIKSRN